MSERKKIEEQALLYHLTCMGNLPSILDIGLRSRASVKGKFIDVADGEIITGREALNLQTMVPFHFFTKNPFDGRVLKDHNTKSFCIISVRRTFANENGWKVIPKHPLSSSSTVSLFDYDEGMNQIDWELMNTRDYKNAECKSVCMAECLSSVTVEPKNFYCIYVKNDNDKKHVDGLLKKQELSIFVTVNSYMF
ncbi:DarT ssDNA thymidine ADP-ribosyltransferase family protein [Morganella morganii]|uniref:DarT ssDNA thymidine ADP-ribosyltransferase family protein n=1 Tax=Morganella morganii TaxID=582 RepID=UPI0028746291|nr:DarT ssDNA thymidine ADP-ribosyltransferase family protein [Morganella morganii]MDS0905407.1 DarT ssDNA thymidine ADP-ribosyltransferase family protein [Morganella morganii]